MTLLNSAYLLGYWGGFAIHFAGMEHLWSTVQGCSVVWRFLGLQCSGGGDVWWMCLSQSGSHVVWRICGLSTCDGGVEW